MATPPAAKPHPISLAGRWVDSPDPLVIANPARADEPAGQTLNATEEQYEEAVDAAVAAFDQTRMLPAYERSAAPDTHPPGHGGAPRPPRDRGRDPGPPGGAGPADRARGRKAGPRRARRG